MESKYQKALLALVEENELPVDLQRLVNRIQSYTGKESIESVTEFTELVFLIAGIMQVPERTWKGFINRINEITLLKETGMTMEELKAMSKDGSNGPLN